MATISQLMEGKKPGEIKIKFIYWTGAQWFSPYFLAGTEGNRWWYGVRQDGLQDEFVASTESCWELYTEPTPKVVWVEYLCISPAFRHWSNAEWHRSIPPDSATMTYHPTGRKIEV